MKAIWPHTIVEENNLTQNISALRRIFGESPQTNRYIVTVPGRGYRFVAAVAARPGQQRLPRRGNRPRRSPFSLLNLCCPRAEMPPWDWVSPIP